MALSDLAVFTEFTYETSVQIVAQQVALFNEASGGAFTLATAANIGDFTDRAKWSRFSGLIRRRNPYGSGNIPAINPAMVTDSMVKIAAGTPVVNLDPSQFTYIQQNPETAGVMMGQQLADAMVLDMFNVAVGAAVAAHIQVESIVTTEANTVSQRSFNKAQRVMGDRYQSIVAWLAHSTTAFNLFDNNLQNAEQLYTFGTLNVLRDFTGRTIIVSDAPALYLPNGADPDTVLTLGLKPGLARIEQNGDFDDNMEKSNGKENIARTYQAEWTYNVGVNGFTWDKQAGGKAPTDAAIMTSTNWDRIPGIPDRDLGCVILENLAVAA